MTESIESTSSSFLTPLASQLCQSATFEISELVQKETYKRRRIVHWSFEKQHQFPLPSSVAAAIRHSSLATNYSLVAGRPKLQEVKKSMIRRRKCWYWTEAIAKSQRRHHEIKNQPGKGCDYTRLEAASLRTVWYLKWGYTSSPSLESELQTANFTYRQAVVLSGDEFLKKNYHGITALEVSYPWKYVECGANLASRISLSSLWNLQQQSRVGVTFASCS